MPENPSFDICYKSVFDGGDAKQPFVAFNDGRGDYLLEKCPASLRNLKEFLPGRKS